jgi:MFS family permease
VRRGFSAGRPHVPSLPFRGTAREEVQDLLQLRRYNEQEIRSAFEALAPLSTENHDKDNTAHVDLVAGLTHLVQEKESRLAADRSALPHFNPLVTERDIATQTSLVQAALVGSAHHVDVRALDWKTFRQLTVAFGEKLDERVWGIAASYLCVGLSVGVIVPCMTLLVAELNMSPSTYGFVVAAFGLSKLLGNIPAAILVEQRGRKPVMLGGTLLCGASLAAVSMVFLPGFGADWLLACRFLAGFGVAGFVAGGNMFMSDVSTALNRTRTIAPVMASFAAGTALGPAVGGALVHTLGLAQSYVAVGCAYAAVALLGHIAIHETALARATVLARQQAISQEVVTDTSWPSVSSLKSSFREALLSWRDLLRSTSLRDVVLLQGASSFALSGAQMTLLPLFLVSPSLALSPTQIATCFAAHSIGAFLAAQPVALLADKIGKHRVLLGGGLLFSVSALALPQATDMMGLLFALVPMSIANATVASAPTALISDLSSQRNRAQAMSLLRTAGDIGLLGGATLAGLIATHASISSALSFDAICLGASAVWFGSKYAMMSQMPSRKE